MAKWRIVYAVDTHGGITLDAINQDEAMELFNHRTAEDLLKDAQVKRIRLLGVVPPQDNRGTNMKVPKKPKK